MKRLQRTVAGCVFALLSVSVVAAPSPNEKAKMLKPPRIVYSEKSDVTVSEDRLKQLLQFMQLRSVLFTAARPCVFQPGGVCVIEVPIILLKDSGGTEYCVGLFPEAVSLPGTASSNPEKTIVWSLIRPSAAPASATFTFFNDKNTLGKAPGIILLSDKNKQMHSGVLGDGTPTTPADATKYLIKNKHKIKGEAVYIPVIVRTDAATTTDPEKVSVCGTPDPRIAND